MSFSFKVDKPKDLRKILENLKKEIEKHKGSFAGDEKKGSISSSGVKGTYAVTDDVIEITITEKPFLWPEFAVKNFITDTFKKNSV